MFMEEVKIEPILESKIMVISDTHIGSKFENFSYIDSVYEFALKHNIKTILHAGDLFQAQFQNVSKTYRKPESQILHLQKDYPHDGSITNKIILGNHDYHMFNKDKNLIKMMRRADLQFVAVRRAYFNWQGQLVSMTHKCPKYTMTIPNLPVLVNFAGHSHKFALHPKKGIQVPTLSDDAKFDSLPGFLVVTLEEELAVELLSFEPELSNPKLVLKKSLNESNE